ncbi:nucleotide pyrophosphohydrolase [bacterium]|nr:nucleotide pyrophosphohydrolase [bacterium]
MQELKDRVRAFRDERDWEQFHNPKDLCIALAIEAAELLELCRFKDTEELEAQIKNGELPEFEHEMSDVLSYLLSLAVRLDIDVTKALLAKMAINAEHYPVELAKGCKAKYTELQSGAER